MKGFIFTALFSLALHLAGANYGWAGNPDSGALQLATNFREDIAIEQYLVSEKLDGVRGRWTGTEMLTRSGRTVPLPKWFTQGWPDIQLDGEIWLGCNRFDEVSALVRSDAADDILWQQVRFMVFDMPDPQLPFSQRYDLLLKLLEGQPHIRPVAQFRVGSLEELNALLDERVKAGAEGLMLHHQDAEYRDGRQKQLLKLKPLYDAEARVLAHLPGKGKYQGMMGALLVRMADGREFRLGTGFSDADRANPPPIGSLVTFQYLGLTSNGLPRFASFVRIRLPD
ncbi:DNA ligase [Shewanella submarina]|uniref:DNA ligase n=1 Tax=Shewanella submarina TaxID=2016376 RepID=A0ABV7GG79_9GAMM|nr:DNA ligase [Shewanella submarina]MCL1039034.1 DNA ligase [Shewanella submarina]